jgi:hypothetical protein
VKRSLTNIFGALGYLACVTQWLWAFTLYTSVILPYVRSVTPKTVSPPIQHSIVTVNPSMAILFFLVGSVVTIIIIAISIWVFIKAPSTIVKTASKVVHETAETVAPAVLRIQHKPDTIANYKKVTSKIRRIIKLLFVVVPAIVAIASCLINKPLFDNVTIILSSLALASISIVLFGIQYILQVTLKVSKRST